MSTYTDKHREYYERNKARILSLRLERERKWIATPKGQFSIQKRKAKQRKIEWQLSFDEWWNIWQESGHWEERGAERGKYCMSRKNDIGPYAVGNVYINLFEMNNKEVYLRNGIDSLGRFQREKS